MTSLQQKRFGVFGLGLSGQALVSYLLRHGASVIAVDRAMVLEQKKALFPIHSHLQFAQQENVQWLSQVDCLLISPGIPFDHPLIQEAEKRHLAVVGEIEFAASLLPHPAIGITGTNGKSTVTALTAHILRENGFSAKAFGNIGVPLVQALESAFVHCVVEISSFQLEAIRTPFLQAACLLNLFPDHLDRYPSVELYEDIKWSIFDYVSASNKPIVSEQLAAKAKQRGLTPLAFGFSPSLPYFSDGVNLYEMGTKVATLPPSLQGKCDFRLQNILAAFALCRTLSLDPEAICRAVATFSPLPHRLEKIGTFSGIFCYNDSKATNVANVRIALETIEAPIFLLMGGRPKGESFASLRDLLCEKVKEVCVFGEAASLIEKDLRKAVPFSLWNKMEDAVYHVLSLAKEGDSVLLSPGCASYDEFDNYMQRGEVFAQLVRNWYAKGEFR